MSHTGRTAVAITRKLVACTDVIKNSKKKRKQIVRASFI